MVVRRGDVAELIVLSDSPSFARFRALREIYLPLQRVWLAEPHECNLEHSIFEQMSVEMAALINRGEVSRYMGSYFSSHDALVDLVLGDTL